MGPSKRLSHDSRQVPVLVAAVLCAILLLALAPGARGEAAVRPNVDRDPGGAPYVAGELLVAYEPETSGEAEQAVVRRSGGRTAENLSGEIRLASLPGIKREQSREARERALQRKLGDLRDEPGVEAADYNYIRKATFVPNDPKFGQPGQGGLRTAGFPNAWDDARGTGARIAIVDSGADSSLSTKHPDIGKIAAQYDFVNGDAVADDRYGHGTHVAGIAAALTNNGRGVAGGCPGCRLLVAKVMDSSGSVTDSALIRGINWSVNHRADVINLSLGGGRKSSVLERKINKANANGAVIVAAAGNRGLTRRPEKPQYPAAYEAAIAVSATNDKDKLAGFSSRGNWVDLAAPGTNILSTRATRVGGRYAAQSGTSESAPFVSALAGLLASRGMSADRIRQRMQNTARDLGPSGKDRYYGHGRINAAGAVP